MLTQHYWTSTAFRWEQDRIRRDLKDLEEARARDARRAHRATPKVERAHKDLLAVLDRLKKYAKMSERQARSTPDYDSTTARLLKQYHRLTRIINQYHAEDDNA